MNAQLAADRGRPDAGRHPVPGPRAALLRPARGHGTRSTSCGGCRRGKLVATGRRRRCEIRAMRAATLGYEPDEDGGDGAEARERSGGRSRCVARDRAGDEARERTAALDTLIDICPAAGVGRGARGRGVSRRARAAARGGASGIGRWREPAHAITGRRGSSGTRSSLPMLEEGIAADPPGARRRRRARRRSGGSSTSGSRARAATWPSRGRSGGPDPATASRSGAPAGSCAPSGGGAQRREAQGRARSRGGRSVRRG